MLTAGENVKKHRILSELLLISHENMEKSRLLIENS